jgi:hypothetical protein
MIPSKIRANGRRFELKVHVYTSRIAGYKKPFPPNTPVGNGSVGRRKKKWSTFSMEHRIHKNLDVILYLSPTSPQLWRLFYYRHASLIRFSEQI